ncbi:MAG TPA: hypothetical protein DD621_01880 [Clostridiales bacterium]|nr:hypothetical protein [Clostridiales bacterium]
MPKFKKYVHLERAGRSEVAGIIGKNVVIQPKLDGCNSSIWIGEDGKIKCGSRNREISVEKDNAGFANYILNNTDDNELVALRIFLLQNPNYIIYGEWLAGINGSKFIGTIKNYLEGGFFIFDVFDIDTGEYLDYDIWYNKIHKFYHRCVPSIAAIDNVTIEDIEKHVNGCTFNLPNGVIGEGIVIKAQPSYRDPWGNVQIMKIVRDEYHSSKSAKKRQDSVQDNYEQTFVDTYCTTAFIEKEVNKVLIALGMDVIDTKNGKFFGMCMQRVIDELMNENFWDFYRKKKVVSVNLAKIKGLSQARIRSYILNY